MLYLSMPEKYSKKKKRVNKKKKTVRRPPRLYKDKKGRYIINNGRKLYIKSDLSDRELLIKIVRLITRQSREKAEKNLPGVVATGWSSVANADISKRSLEEATAKAKEFLEKLKTDSETKAKKGVKLLTAGPSSSAIVPPPVEEEPETAIKEEDTGAGVGGFIGGLFGRREKKKKKSRVETKDEVLGDLLSPDERVVRQQDIDDAKRKIALAQEERRQEEERRKQMENVRRMEKEEQKRRDEELRRQQLEQERIERERRRVEEESRRQLEKAREEEAIRAQKMTRDAELEKFKKKTKQSDYPKHLEKMGFKLPDGAKKGYSAQSTNPEHAMARQQMLEMMYDAVGKEFSALPTAQQRNNKLVELVDGYKKPKPTRGGYEVAEGGDDNSTSTIGNFIGRVLTPFRRYREDDRKTYTKLSESTRKNFLPENDEDTEPSDKLQRVPFNMSSREDDDLEDVPVTVDEEEDNENIMSALNAGIDDDAMLAKDSDRLKGKTSKPRAQGVDESDAEYAEYLKAFQGGKGKNKKDEGGLLGSEIEDMMRKHKSFSGVYSSDELNLLPNKKTQGFIMNLDPSNKPGSHWVAVYMDDKRKQLAYYDPFGAEPSKDFQRRMKEVIDRIGYDTYLKFKVNKIKDQKADTDTCGYHSMLFLKDMMKGRKFKEATGFNALKGERRAKAMKKKFSYI